MLDIAYYTVTGQTRRFIKKTGYQAYEINDADPFHEMGRPFILIVPAYDDNMMDGVVDFLTFESNRKNLVGIIGTGNRNFNELYIHTAKDLATGFKVPILYDFEFNGTPKDVERVKEIVQAYEPKTNWY